LGFCKTKRYGQLKNAINIAGKQVLRFENENGHITEWMPWLTYCKLDTESNLVTIQINERLYDYVLDIRNTIGFSLIFLSDYVRLKSRYAYRWFEIILSRTGHAGKEGRFYVEYSLAEIRKIFIVNKQYPLNADFIINIVKKPVQEIIDKKLGFHIFVDCLYGGGKRKITGVRLHCSFAKREDGTEPISYYLSLHSKAYFQCLMQVKKFSDCSDCSSDDNTPYMLEAVKLLKERMGNHE
jgi:plasmid replication initiation protein